MRARSAAPRPTEPAQLLFVLQRYCIRSLQMTLQMTQFPQRHPLGYGSPRIPLLLNLAYNASAMVHLNRSST